ncbi:MAG: cytochrome c oxidase assembly protein [Actinobacteria bacterium]|nr:cytochrome c oxidase assembly protein [Actinomycetota bacterium]MBI3686433.1 cytochrome c oxidase assembly protein [Actinomycetota bacterium]
MPGMPEMPLLPPLTGWRLLTTWHVRPVVTALAVLAVVAYLAGVARLNRRHPAHRWSGWRTVAFLAGILVAVVAIEGGPGQYGEVLFWVHMVRHLMLIMLAPWLVAMGYPVTLLLRATRGASRRRIRGVLRSAPVSLLTHPLVTLGGYVVVVVGLHLTGFMQAMMERSVLAEVEIVACLGVGYLEFSQTLTREPYRWDLPYPLRLFMQFVAMTVDTIAGVVLLQTTRVPWPAFADGGRTWGPSPLDDLHGGAAVMWIGGDALMLVMMLVLAGQWLSDGRPEAARVGRWLESARQAALADTGGRLAGDPDRAALMASPDVDDGDAALAAYNAMLTRLAEHDGLAPAAGPATRRR